MATVGDETMKASGTGGAGLTGARHVPDTLPGNHARCVADEADNSTAGIYDQIHCLPITFFLPQPALSMYCLIIFVFVCRVPPRS